MCQNSVITIRNINPKFGDGLIFAGTTLDDAKANMAEAISDCGTDFLTEGSALVEGTDFEVVEFDQTETHCHFTNLGASMQPPCADQEGFVSFRKNFQELSESEWTEGEQWIDGMEKQIAAFRNQ